MIDPAFRNHLDQFADGSRIRTAVVATTGPSKWVAAALGLASIAAMLSLSDFIGTVPGAAVAAMLMFGAVLAWVNHATYAVMLTDTELVVLETYRLAPHHPHRVIDSIALSGLDLRVRNSPSSFASLHVDDYTFKIPSRHYTGVQTLRMLAGGAQSFSLASD